LLCGRNGATPAPSYVAAEGGKSLLYLPR